MHRPSLKTQARRPLRSLTRRCPPRSAHAARPASLRTLRRMPRKITPCKARLVRLCDNPGAIDLERPGTALEWTSSRRPAPVHAARVPARLARFRQRRASDTGWQPQLPLLERRRPAGRRLPAVPEDAIPTASTCSTGPGPTPTQRHGLATTPSCSAPCPSRPCRRPRLLAPRRAAHAGCCCARCSSSRQQASLSSAAPAVPRRSRPGGGTCARLDAAPARCSSIGSTASRSPMPTSRTSSRGLQRDKRKKIQQERRRVARRRRPLRARIAARTIDARADWDLFHRCYTLHLCARTTPRPT